MGLSGLEPLTSRLSGVRSSHLSYRPLVTSCFSKGYAPMALPALGGSLLPHQPSIIGKIIIAYRSQFSAYSQFILHCKLISCQMIGLSRLNRYSLIDNRPGICHCYGRFLKLLRKEVIQPHLPIRLPCYDFTPLAQHTIGISLPKVGIMTSGTLNSGSVTGGVYKARERIHRDLLIRGY